jgi:hypothetical protein
MTFAASIPRRALFAGATSLLILSGMIVGHAWPLWTGRVVTMKVVPVDPRDLFRGEYVHLDTPATQLYRTGTGVKPSPAWTLVRPIDRVFDAARPGSVVYVQLAPSESGEYVPVSVSRAPEAGALNLRGRARWAPGAGALAVDYGKGRRIEEAIRQRRNVQMQIAIASSGHARLKMLLIDGVPVDRF